MSYRKLSELVNLVDIKNSDCKVTRVIGVSITKNFIKSVANLHGVDLTKYNLIKKNQFACKLMSVGRDLQLPIDLYKEDDLALISSAYYVFEVKDENEILPDYLNMWFRRKETDRWVGYISGGDVRGGISWDMFLEMDVNVPSIEKQSEIVTQYHAVANKIKVNEQICEKLEATAQTLYKQWFVDFEFPKEEGQPYKSSGGVMVFNKELEKEIPEGWEVGKLETVSNLKYGKMLDSDKFLDTGYPVFSGYGVRGYYSEYMYEEPQILVLCRGVSGTGEVKLSPKYSYITNLSIVVELQEDVMTKYFTYYYLKNDDLRTLDSGSAQSMITTGDLYFRNILKPKYPVQVEFDNKISKLKNCEEIVKNENQKLTQLQSLLLSRLATLEG